MADYYERYSRVYFERTARIDPAPFLSPFADRLPAGATVLDVGCGSGRDLLWLKRRGFAVTGFERSAGLADLARAHAGCPVIGGDFATFDFSSLTFDALLLSGALVHLSPERLSGTLGGILKALDTPGWVYLSLKAGRGRRTDRLARTFYLWAAADLEPLLKAQGLRILHASRSPSAVGTGEPWLGYVLANGQRTGRRA